MNNFVFDPTRKFLDPERVLFTAGLAAGQTFADFGSGSGFYTIAAAKIVGEQGIVYSVDILEPALDHIVAEARLKNLRNIKTLMCDLEQTASCNTVPVGSVDMVLFANITHQIKNRSNLFAEAYRLLKTGGKLVVIEWNEQPSPIGPVSADRISEAEVMSVAKKSGLKSAGEFRVDPYHYGSIYIK
ncbi:MAG: methyltransferase domain-containing protein [Candidatus Doudnabacteria bacterium]|nr:methyltransferase domain-containing protein [Candidatus Doudnabacteria bacterium]